jgi:molybdate/tungstate transport system substrate-binding protein
MWLDLLLEKAPRLIKQALLPRLTVRFLLAVLVLGCGCSSACTPTPAEKTKLVVFEAGSLMVPFAQMEKEFETANPDIDVEIQAHGSIQVIRHLTELGEDVDIVAVADYSLIPLLMYQTMMPDGKPYADWYIKPAANQLVLAYTPNSKYAGELNADNWYEIITRPDVRIGLADPRMDAVGYRTLMVTKLAESFYDVDGIMRNAIGRYFTVPIIAREEDGISLITVPELLEPSDDRMYLRGASMQLVALLQSNDIDYTFEYESVVAQQGLNYLELPPEISLGDENYIENYSKVRVKLDFRRFKSVIPEFEGLPIAYGMTIAANSEQKEEAARFIEFVLSPDGQRIFSENHHPPLVPPECDNVAALPDELKVFFP